MAIFGGREVYVGTSVSRMVDDEMLPDIQRTAPIKAILSGGDLPGTIVDDLLAGTGIKVDRAFKYARDGGYTIGLPQHTFLNGAVGKDAVKHELEIIHGGPVSITYHHYAAPNNLHIAFSILKDSYGYRETTNEIVTLSGLKGFDVYLENIVGTIDSRVNSFVDPNDEDAVGYTWYNLWSLSGWETSPNERNTPWTNIYFEEPIWELTEQASSIKVYYAYDNGTDIVREVLTLSMAPYDLSKGYFQTKYSYDLSNPSGAKQKYFTYRQGLGAYSAIDASIYQDAPDAEFLPIAFFRHGDVDITAESYRSGQDYITTKKLFKKLGLNYQAISDAIHENEDINDVEEALLLFAIPMNTELKAAQQYLYEFFNWLITNDTSLVLQVRDTVSGFEERLANIPVSQSVSLEDGNFMMTLKYGGASSEIIDSALPVGDVYVSDFHYTVDQDYYVTRTIDDQPTRVKQTRQARVTTYRITKQLTENTAHQVYISGLSIAYQVGDREVEIDASEDAGRILIPVNYAIAEATFTRMQRDAFYASSMHLVFNSRVSQHIPWYATGIFKAFLFIATVVVTAISLGSIGPGIQTAYAAAAALGLGTTAAVVIVALKYIAVNMLVEAGFKFAADQLGAEFVMALAVIGTAVGLYGNQNNKIWAENLLMYSSNMMKAAENKFAMDTAAIMEESAEFQEQAQALTEELEEAQSLLKSSMDVDLFNDLYLAPLVVPGESPDQFYARTITPNVGTAAYDYIKNYVDIKLALPTIQDTLKEFDSNGV